MRRLLALTRQPDFFPCFTIPPDVPNKLRSDREASKGGIYFSNVITWNREVLQSSLRSSFRTTEGMEG